MSYAEPISELASMDAPRELSIDQVVQALEFDIVFGRFKPRERLVEDGLMARFKVKRHVVRKALAELERMGIVVRYPNRGAAVRDFSAREVEEIYELRELLQRRAAERMPLPADAALVDRLRAIQQRHDAAVATGDLRTVDQVNDLFHREFFAACDSHHLAEAISHYAQITRAMRIYPIADPISLGLLRHEHWEMIEALAVGDRPALMRLVVQHLQPSKKTYLALRRAIDSQPVGEP